MNLAFSSFNEKEKLSDQRKLFLKCFPETEGTSASSVEHYNWKFNQFPHGEPSYEFVAEEGDTLAGYYAAIPYSYWVSGKKLVAGMVCDVMTSPEMQGRGVFTKLGRFATDSLEENGLDFTTGYPVRPEVIPGHLKVGWKVAFELPVFASPVSSIDILKPKGVGFLAPVADIAISAFHFILSLINPVSKDYEVEEFDQTEIDAITGLADFQRAWAETQTNYLEKSKEFFKWRLGAPGQSYRLHCVYRDSNLVAVAITKVCKLQDVKALAILDLMAIDPKSKCMNSLFHSLYKSAKRNKVAVIAGMFSRFWAKQYRLARFGFLVKPAVFKLIIKPLSDTAKKLDLYREEDWHLMWIDSDDL